MKISFQLITDLSLILIGIVAAGFGLKGFLLPNHLIDGGVTGISMLISALYNIPLFILLLIINMPFIVLGFKKMGYRFALKSTLAITGLALCLFFIEFPLVTHDKLLTSIFGGIFLGFGIGLTIRSGAVLDGTEIAALYVNQSKYKLKVGDVILLFNILIFASAAFLLGIEPAMYSVLTYISASKTMDFLIHGLEQYNTMIIISPKYTAIRDTILSTLKRNIFSYSIYESLNNDKHEVLYCVVTRLEVINIRKIIHQIDPVAFITVHPLASAEGASINSVDTRIKLAAHQSSAVHTLFD